jgi:hypothetical protein
MPGKCNGYERDLINDFNDVTAVTVEKGIQNRTFEKAGREGGG